MSKREAATRSSSDSVDRLAAVGRRRKAVQDGDISHVRVKSVRSNGRKPGAAERDAAPAKPRGRNGSPVRAAATRVAGPQLHARQADEGGHESSDTRLRFHLASLLRMSDNIVSRAVGAYDRLFALDRRDQAEIYLDMGRRLIAQGKTEQALEALRKAAHLRPGDGEVLVQVGLAHLHQPAPEAAVRVFGRAKEAGAASHDLYQGMADALVMQEKYAEALEALERALEIQAPGAEDLFRLGTVLDRLGRYEEACVAFRKALDLAPREVAYHQSLGFTLESMGRRREAIKCFKRALELERPVISSGLAERR